MDYKVWFLRWLKNIIKKFSIKSIKDFKTPLSYSFLLKKIENYTKKPNLTLQNNNYIVIFKLKNNIKF
jgi:hypothetical protein